VLRRTRHLDPADIWLATTDADTVVPAGWLRQQERHASQGWDAVAGTIEVADWSGYQPATRTRFSERYDGGTGPHPHVHGANLGFRASAYLMAGGFPAEPTAEDHAFVSALAACGCRVLRTRALPVVTSARRDGVNGTGGYPEELLNRRLCSLTPSCSVSSGGTAAVFLLALSQASPVPVPVRAPARPACRAEG
jgi:hypothetical protein